MQVNIAVPCYVSAQAQFEGVDDVAVMASHILRTEAQLWLRSGASVRVSCPRAHKHDEDPLSPIVTTDPLPAHADVWILHVTPDAPLLFDPREIRHGIVIAHLHQPEALPAQLHAADLILANTLAAHRRLLAQDGTQAHWLGMPAWPPPTFDVRATQYAQIRAQHGLADDARPLALVWLSEQPSSRAAWEDLCQQVEVAKLAQVVESHHLGEFLRDLPAADMCVVAAGAGDDVAQFAALTAAAWGVPVVLLGSSEADVWLASSPSLPAAETLARWLRDPVQRSYAGRVAQAAAAAYLPVAWQARLSQLVHQAQAHVVPLPPLPAWGDSTPDRPSPLEGKYAQLNAQADVMLRGYTVVSSVPVFGRLIAWIRRNLTSHLREPYLDPMLERQVAFNRAVVRALARLEQSVQQVELAKHDPPSSSLVRQRIEQYKHLAAQLLPGSVCHVIGAGDISLLSALRAAEIQVRGCDDDTTSTAAQMQGFAIHRMPALEYLRALSAHECEGMIISAARAAASLTDLWMLVTEARRTLKTGGRLVLLEVDTLGDALHERAVELRTLLQAVGLTVVASHQPALARSVSLDDAHANLTIESRLERLERAVFDAAFSFVWVVGERR